MSCPTSYDRWFHAKIQEALGSKKPRIPHDFDPECNSFWAESPDINGLCASGKEVCLAVELLLELQYDPKAKTYTTSRNLPDLAAEANNTDELMQAVSDCVDLLTR